LKTLTVFELEFMRKLWAMGGATPEEMVQSFAAQGRVLTGGTIRKMLGILIDKQFVVREKKGKTYIYRPKVSAEKTKSGLVKDILNRAYDGSFSNMFASFINNESINEDDLKSIAQIIETRIKENKP
jgi:BlaI family transcriptional regulator, penicillinase repressor